MPPRTWEGLTGFSGLNTSCFCCPAATSKSHFCWKISGPRFRGSLKVAVLIGRSMTLFLVPVRVDIIIIISSSSSSVYYYSVDGFVKVDISMLGIIYASDIVYCRIR